MRLRIGRAADDALLSAEKLLTIVTLLFLILPLVMAITMSFDSRIYLGQFPPPSLSLQWYIRFFSDTYYLTGLKLSLALATSTAIASTVIGVTAALAIERSSEKMRDILTSLLVSPLIVPGVVVGFALLLFFARLGVTNGFVRLALAHILITFPYVLRTTVASLAGIPKSMVEAALGLGANERRAFWTVTLPLAKPGIVAGMIFAFAFSLDDVAVSLFLSDPYYYTLPVALVTMMYSNFDLTIASASVLFVGITIALMICLDRFVGLDRIVGAGPFKV